MELVAPRPIPEFDCVDEKTFSEIRASAQPAVFRGMAKDWPAVQAALTSDEVLIDYLRPKYTEREIAAIVGSPQIEGRFFYNADFSRLNFKAVPTGIGAVLQRLLNDRDEPRPYAIAIQSEIIPNLFPGFEHENRMPLLDAGVVPRAWIGNRIHVATHYDLMENIGVVVCGRRRFTLFPPDQIANLYPGPFDLTPAGTPISMVDPNNPDLDAFPRYVEAASRAQQAELEPGDAIYIPFHWWHAVDSLGTFNFFANYWWNDARKDGGHPYHALMYAFYALRPLPPEQREVWRQAFDYYIFENSGDPGAHLPEKIKGALAQPDTEQLARLKQTLKQILSSLN